MKALAPILLATVLGCGSDPANVEGNYTMAVTNRDNGCPLANWTVGTSTPNIGVTITQQGSNASATINGLVGVFVSATLGTNVYTGSVSGNDVTLEVLGTRSMTMGNCTFTYNSTILGTADGDTMTGRVEYRGAGNGNPDCSTITGCLSYQDFNGTRPP